MSDNQESAPTPLQRAKAKAKANNALPVFTESQADEQVQEFFDSLSDDELLAWITHHGASTDFEKHLHARLTARNAELDDARSDYDKRLQAATERLREQVRVLEFQVENLLAPHVERARLATPTIVMCNDCPRMNQ